MDGVLRQTGSRRFGCQVLLQCLLGQCQVLRCELCSGRINRLKLSRFHVKARCTVGCSHTSVTVRPQLRVLCMLGQKYDIECWQIEGRALRQDSQRRTDRKCN